MRKLGMSDKPVGIPQIFVLRAPDGGESVIAKTVISDPKECMYVGAIIFFRDQGGLRQAFEVSEIMSRADADGGGFVVRVEPFGLVETDVEF